MLKCCVLISGIFGISQSITQLTICYHPYDNLMLNQKVTGFKRSISEMPQVSLEKKLLITFLASDVSPENKETK